MRASATLLLSLVVASISAQLSQAAVETMNFDSFAVGDCVEVEYVVPSRSRVTISLFEENDDVLVYVDYRIKYRNQQNLVALRSRVGGRWSIAKYIKNIDSTPGTSVIFAICATTDNVVSIDYNGKILTPFSYKDTNINNLRRVTVDTRGSGAKVQEVCISYA